MIKCIKGIEDNKPWTTLKIALILLSSVFEIQINTSESKSISYFDVTES